MYYFNKNDDDNDKRLRNDELKKIGYVEYMSIYDGARKKLEKNKDADVRAYSELILKGEQPLVNFYAARDFNGVNIYEHLNVVLNSNNAFLNYLCLRSLFKSKYIKGEDRFNQVLKHADVIFNSNDYKYIIKVMDFLGRRPEYKDYLSSKGDYYHYQKMYEEEEKEKERVRKQELEEYNKKYAKDLIAEPPFSSPKYSSKNEEELSKIVFEINIPEWHFMMVRDYNINKFKHLQALIDSKDAYWNYKCVKYFVKTKDLDDELKNLLALLCADVVYNSGNIEVINKLNQFLCNKPLYQDYVEEKKNNIR